MRDTILTAICPFCGKETEIAVNFEDYLEWQYNDAHVQDAFPYLSTTEREVLISEICPDCQETIF